VYGFQNLHSDYSHQINTSADVDHPTLWDQLSPAVVANVPMTYPAPSIDGEFVARMMAPEMNEQFTHPTALRDEITEAIPDYGSGSPGASTPTGTTRSSRTSTPSLTPVAT